MEIIEASEKDIPVIHDLAVKIWWPTYRPILSDEQISFMLENMYSESALLEQMRGDVNFILVQRENKNVAFAGYSVIHGPHPVLKIHKIYVLTSEQGKGTGKNLIAYLTNHASSLNIPNVQLNVNRANPALGFYQRMGFVVIETADIPYYQFELNDYVMQKTLPSVS